MFFDCPKTADARSKYQNWIYDVFDAIEMIFTLPICTITQHENVLTTVRYERPLPRANFNLDNSLIRTFYTDGSSSIADFEIDREASWAVIEDKCQSDITREVMMEHYFHKNWIIPPTFKTLQVGMVRGPQTINRAELTAI